MSRQMKLEQAFSSLRCELVRQEENQYLSCPPEIAKGLSPELRSL